MDDLNNDLNQNEKKKSGGAVRFLIKLLIFAAVLVLVFLVSYTAVGRWYAQRLDEKDAATQEAEEATAQQQAEETVENCEFTMIYLDDPETEEVEFCALKVFHRMNQELSVFMIPTDSQVTMSSALSEEITEKAGTEVGQTVLLSELGPLFTDRETKYEVITSIVKELIGGLDLKTYEAIDYDNLIQIIDLADPITMNLAEMVTYTDEDGQTMTLTPNTEHEIDGRKALGILTYSDGFGSGDSGRIERSSTYLMEYITTLTDTLNKTEMGTFLSNYYGLITTNGSVSDSTSYIEDCLALNNDNMAFYTMKGTQQEEIYTLDAAKIQEDMKSVMGEDAYALAATEQAEESTTAADSEAEEGTASESETGVEAEATEAVSSSKDLTITIYNGAYISGLAGNWRDKLEEEGYTIEGIFDYSGGTRDNGKIIVREEGMGEDLKQNYFPNAEIEVGTPDDGADIQIILGKSEDF
ncbi:MAG: LytR C-terminal domain-containing protein [Lachnospiraceae bacterium]|nr:LytR C-terminal domain-containing protein [Lachnospiraceae bacterium]